MIEYEDENDCVGCDYCVNCGKKYAQRIIYKCDKCYEKDEDLRLYDVNGKQLCEECVVRHWVKTSLVDDIVDLIYNNHAEEEILEKYKEVEAW